MVTTSANRMSPWKASSLELATWAHTHLVNRDDVYGTYKGNGEGVKKVGKVGPTLLDDHFLGRRVIGLYTTSTTNTSRWFAFDVDCHDDDTSDVVRDGNFEQAQRLAAYLKADGFASILEDSNGAGGFHVWVILAEPVPTAAVHAYCKHVLEATGIDCEIFPKQAALANGRYGNWLRLPGRHHTRQHWSRVWVGRWLEGADAASELLKHEGDSPDVVLAFVPDKYRDTDAECVNSEVAVGVTPDKKAEALKRAAAYVEAVDGVDHERNNAAYKLAAKLTVDFALDEVDAWPLLRSWNARNDPPLDQAELRDVLANATEYGNGAKGGELVVPNITIGTKASPTDKPKSRALVRRMDTIVARPLDWLWANRLPLGKLSLVGGVGNIGKTFVSLDIAGRISNGRPWPDDRNGKNPAGDVVIVSAEDDVEDTIKPRLETIGADHRRVFWLDGIATPASDGDDSVVDPFTFAGHLRHLEDVLSNLPNPRLVLFDPLSAFLGRDADSHKDADVRRVLGPLSQLANRRRVTVLGIVHLSKANIPGNDATMRILGSVAFTNAARAIWMVYRDQNHDGRRMFLPGKWNLMPQQPSGLYYEIDAPGIVRWHDGPVNMTADDVAACTQPAREDAKGFLHNMLANGPMSATFIEEAAKAADITKRTLDRAKSELRVRSERGRDDDRQWYWRLPEK